MSELPPEVLMCGDICEGKPKLVEVVFEINVCELYTQALAFWAKTLHTRATLDIQSMVQFTAPELLLAMVWYFPL